MIKKRPITQKEQILDHGRLIGVLRKELKELKTKYDGLEKRLKYQEEKMAVLLKWRMTVVEDIENLLILLHYAKAEAK